MDSQVKSVEFLEVLSSVGFPGVNQLDVNSIEWLFADEVFGTLMRSLCVELGATEKLEDNVLRQFSELCESHPDDVLSGEALQSSLQHLSLLLLDEDEDDELKTEQQLLQDIDDLEVEVQKLNVKKDFMVQHRDILKSQHLQSNNTSTRLKTVQANTKKGYDKELANMTMINDSLDEAVAALQNSITSVITFYAKALADGSSLDPCTHRCMFLSQANLEMYFKVEEKFTQSLTQYAKKKFSKTAVSMSIDKESSQYEYLDVSNPVSLLVTQDRQDTLFDFCKSLVILHACYPQNEAERISALLFEQSAMLSCKFIEENERKLEMVPYPKDDPQLRLRLAHTQDKLSALRKTYHSIKDCEIPALLQDCTDLYITPVLQGNYEVKILRQNYFIHSQNQVIEQLIQQKSRMDFLASCLEAEQLYHHNMKKLLTATYMLLQQRLSDHNQALAAMKELTHQTNRETRCTVDSRDHATLRLNALLSSLSTQQGTIAAQHKDNTRKQVLYVTHSDMVDNTRRLVECVDKLHTQHHTHQSAQTHRQHRFEGCIEHCVELLYPDKLHPRGAIPTATQVMLNPKQVADNVQQLGQLVTQLEKSCSALKRDYRKRKQAISSDRITQVERQLFVNFFTDHEKLRQIIAELEEQHKANMITR